MESREPAGPHGVWERHPTGGAHPAPEVLWELPFPVAHPAEAAFTHQAPEARIKALIEAYRCLTRFLALLTLGHYLRNPKAWRNRTDEKLRSILTEKISDGNWKSALWTASWAYRHARHHFTVSPLVSFLYQSNGERTERATTFFDWLGMRTGEAHTEAAKEDTPAEAMAREWTERLSADLRDFRFLGSYDLLQPMRIRGGVVESGRLFRGPSVNPPLMEEVNLRLTVGGVEPEDGVLLFDRNDPEKQLSLTPFFHPGEPGDPLFVFQMLEKVGDGVTGAIYVSAAGRRGARALEEFSDARARREEFQALFGRLGEVGAGVAPTTLRARAFAGGGGPWETVERLTKAWVQSGYSYDVILEQENADGLKEAVDTPRIWTREKSPEVEAFILVLALHYRLSWQFWVARNTRNAIATRQLLGIHNVANRHHRPRLRALYALQSFDKHLLEETLREGKWDPRTVEIVRRHVLTGQVKEYLRFLARSSEQYPLPHRAEEVLSEVSPTGGGGIDLPLGPEDPEAGGNPARDH